MGERSRFDAVVEGSVVVVGQGDGILRDVQVPDLVHVRPAAATTVPGHVTALVLDATSVAPRDLAAIRRLARYRAVPLLVLAAEDGDDIEALRPDDVVVGHPGAREIGRRLGALRELGRTRLALAFAEQALEESVSGLTVADVDAAEHPLVHVSPVFEAMTGYPASEALGASARVLDGSDTDPTASAVLRDSLTERKRARVVLRSHRRDGTVFWNEVTVFPLVDPAGSDELPRWMGEVQHDVTELVEARAELDVLYRLLGEQRSVDQAVLDGLDAGVVTAVSDGEVRLVNHAAAELLRMPRESCVGRPVHELLGLEAPPARMLAGHVRRVLVYELVRPDGARVDVELSMSRAGGSESSSFFFVFRDRAREKKLELERARFERLAAMGTMVAGFAHEVRNPVASLRSLAESLAEELSQRDIPLPHLARMLRALERIERLVRTSLQFGRPATPRRARYRPWAILGQATEALSARMRELGSELRVEVEPDLPDVYVDESQLVQVLVVLLNNAIDATGAPSRVAVRARSSVNDGERGRTLRPSAPTNVRFEVEDDGPGVPAEHLGRIFDPFFTTKSAGTGLGLSIAQQLVSENGGRLEVTSPRGGPTVFAVTVPTDRRTS